MKSFHPMSRINSGSRLGELVSSLKCHEELLEKMKQTKYLNYHTMTNEKFLHIFKLLTVVMSRLKPLYGKKTCPTLEQELTVFQKCIPSLNALPGKLGDVHHIFGIIVSENFESKKKELSENATKAEKLTSELVNETDPFREVTFANGLLDEKRQADRKHAKSIKALGRQKAAYGEEVRGIEKSIKSCQESIEYREAASELEKPSVVQLLTGPVVGSIASPVLSALIAKYLCDSKLSFASLGVFSFLGGLAGALASGFYADEKIRRISEALDEFKESKEDEIYGYQKKKKKVQKNIKRLAKRRNETEGVKRRELADIKRKKNTRKTKVDAMKKEDRDFQRQIKGIKMDLNSLSEAKHYIDGLRRLQNKDLLTEKKKVSKIKKNKGPETHMYKLIPCRVMHPLESSKDLFYEGMSFLSQTSLIDEFIGRVRSLYSFYTSHLECVKTQISTRGLFPTLPFFTRLGYKFQQRETNEKEVLLLERMMVKSKLDSFVIGKQIGGVDSSPSPSSSSSSVVPDYVRNFDGSMSLVYECTFKGYTRRKFVLKACLNSHACRAYESQAQSDGSIAHQKLLSVEFIPQLPVHQNLLRTHFSFIDTFDPVYFPEAKHLFNGYIGKKTAVLIMELCRGTLKHYMQIHRTMQARRLIDFIRHVATGLLELKKIGIIHRDIKPDNLFYFEQDGMITWAIGDFGKRLETVMCINQSNVIFDFVRSQNEGGGAPAYMPPEIEFDETSRQEFPYDKYDVYSLGVVCRQICRKNISNYDNLTQSLSEEECPNDSIRTLVEKMCCDYEDRISVEELLAEAKDLKE